MDQRGEVSSLAERFRVLVRAVGVNVSVLTPEMVTVTCETREDFQRARGRIEAAIQMLHIAAEVEIEGLYLTIHLGEAT